MAQRRNTGCFWYHETLSVVVLGVVPDDKGITVSTNKGEPIVLDDKALAGQAFMNIAKRITGEKVPLLDLNIGGGFCGIEENI